MHGLCGNGAREKTAFSPIPYGEARAALPLWTRVVDMAWAPLERPAEALLRSASLGSLVTPMDLAWSLDLWGHLGRRVTPMLAVFVTATVVVTVAAGTRCTRYGLTGSWDADQSPPGPEILLLLLKLRVLLACTYTIPSTDGLEEA